MKIVDKYGYIYLIENDLNDKLYIGRTLDPHKREAAHFSDYSNTLAIKSAIKKYGKEHFDFVILEACVSEEDLNNREKYWIVTLNTLSPFGYNLKEGGKSGRPTEITRNRMRLAHKGVPLSNEHRSSIGISLLGHEVSEKTRLKISLSHRGLMHSDVSREKMSISHKGKKLSLKTRLKMSAAKKGKSTGLKSREHRLKIGAAMKGKSLSAEHKQKISKALVGNRNAAK